jgi:hypothetical protein
MKLSILPRQAVQFCTLGENVIFGKQNKPVRSKYREMRNCVGSIDLFSGFLCGNQGHPALQITFSRERVGYRVMTPFSQERITHIPEESRVIYRSGD